MSYKKDQVDALVKLHKSVQTPAQKKVNQTVDRLIELKIRLEQITYTAQQIEKTISFNNKDLNEAIQAIQGDAANRFEIVSSAESNLKYLVTVELPDKLNSIKFLQSKIKRLVR